MPPRSAIASDTERDPRWRQVLARDAAADGSFVYSVKTTGVYCRPSCPSRPARPHNVDFHADAAAAQAAGFRPCKRCHPERAGLPPAHGEAIEAACRRLADADGPPTLEQLAAIAGLSPFHFHRLFKAHTGLTPHAYAQTQRRQRVAYALAQGHDVTTSLYAAGYRNASPFYAQAQAMLGMPAATYRAGAPRQRIRFALAQCSLGALLVAQSERGVCAISLGDDPQALLEALQQRFAKAELIGADAAFEKQVAQVVGLIEQPQRAHQLPLDIQGTAFQQRVWQALQQIPAGQTISYAELARRIGAPGAARAVAGACAANPLAVAVPCHRVVRNDGALSGYRWGVARKQALLDREGAP